MKIFMIVDAKDDAESVLALWENVCDLVPHFSFKDVQISLNRPFNELRSLVDEKKKKNF